jgi:hypothetical protein
MKKRSIEYTQKALKTRAKNAIINHKITKEKILNEGLTHKGLSKVGKKVWPFVLDSLGMLEDSGYELSNYSKQDLIKEVLRLRAEKRGNAE